MATEAEHWERTLCCWVFIFYFTLYQWQTLPIIRPAYAILWITIAECLICQRLEQQQILQACNFFCSSLCSDFHIRSLMLACYCGPPGRHWSWRIFAAVSPLPVVGTSLAGVLRGAGAGALPQIGVLCWLWGPILNLWVVMAIGCLSLWEWPVTPACQLEAMRGVALVTLEAMLMVTFMEATGGEEVMGEELEPATIIITATTRVMLLSAAALGHQQWGGQQLFAPPPRSFANWQFDGCAKADFQLQMGPY